MREFLIRQRENLVANLIAECNLYSFLGVLTSLASVPPVSVPAWLFVAVLAFASAWWWFSSPPKKLTQIANQEFGVERVIMDGKHFTGCNFDGSELIFRGTSGMSMSHCQLTGIRIKFEGAASLTMEQLTAIYSDPGFRFIAEQAINQVITNGKQIEESRAKQPAPISEA